MNETKFTPGPWKQDYPNSIISLDGKQIAITYNSSCDARLIAAAPDIFDALTKWCADYEAFRRNEFSDQNAIEAIYKEAKAAIAKATT